MAITGITVTVDRTNYSRYDKSAHLINVVVKLTGAPAGGEQITLLLKRDVESGQALLGTSTIAAIANQLSYTAQIDLLSLLDADGFPLARCSREYQDYTLTASLVSPALSATALLSVVPITVEAMKKRWCNGLPLISKEILNVRIQPQQITGVTLSALSYGAGAGIYPLVFVPGSPGTLAWGGGLPVALDPAVTEFVLPDSVGGSIIATVNQALLPVQGVTEKIYVDFGLMTDETIIREIIAKFGVVEDDMHIYLEPTRVVTRMFIQLDPQSLPSFYDRVVAGLNFYKPDNWMKWLEIKLPYNPVLAIKKLSGYFNQSIAVNIDGQIITYDDRSGQISFVPSNLAVVNSFFVGPGLYVMFFNQLYVPQFWNFSLVCGFKKTPSPIMEYIGQRAAIMLLSEAAQARYPNGSMSYSVSRDGVAESQTLNPRIYGVVIQALENETNPGGRDKIISLRNRYTPMAFTSL